MLGYKAKWQIGAMDRYWLDGIETLKDERYERWSMVQQRVRLEDLECQSECVMWPAAVLLPPPNAFSPFFVPTVLALHVSRQQT